jgi:hypothetical protein
MAQPSAPQPVKFICGMIAGDTALLDRAQLALGELLGAADLLSPIYPFDTTDYYEPEMGPGLLRQFVTFDLPASPERLAEIKVATNAIEAAFAADSNLTRPVNLDPGYLTRAKLVLASMKNFAHRIYLRDGVYAEVTLIYKHGHWEAAPWTFPDYASGLYDDFLNQARCRYHEQIS